MEPLMFKIIIPFGCLMIILNMSVSYDYIIYFQRYHMELALIIYLYGNSSSARFMTVL